MFTVPWLAGLPEVKRVWLDWTPTPGSGLKKKWVDGFTDIALVREEGLTLFPALVVVDRGRRSVHNISDKARDSSAELLKILNSLN